jgi:DNA polymerase-3 subunit delta
VIAAFYGKDGFSAHEALAALTKDLDSGTSEDGLGDTTVRVEGRAAKPDELLGICQTVPFLAAHRLVVVDGLLGRFEQDFSRRGRAPRRAKTEESALGAWQPFIDALPHVPETTTLVFMDGDLSARNPFLKALPKDARVQEFKPLAQADVAGWILRRAPKYGMTIQARAIAALSQLVGNQLWLLDSELQKLATYANGSEVTADDVRQLVSFARDPNIFAMVDAVVEGRTRDSIELLQRLLQEGEAPQRLLAVVARQYRLLLMAKELLEQRVRPPEISARLEVQGFVIQRLLQQAPLYTIDKLRRAYRLLLDADLSVKRGIHDDETALELLIFQLAALAARRPGATPPGGQRAAPPRAARA